MTLRIIGTDALAAITPDQVIAGARGAFIRHAQGLIVAPPPTQLLFDQANGDVHIKSGYALGGAVAVIKIASGFYDNPRHGLPVNDGMLLVLSSRTGEPLALIHDRGLLTSWRTAAAGALAAEAGALPGTPVLGIVGTGHQAALQAIWIARHLGLSAVRLLGRSADRTAALVQALQEDGLDARPATSIDELCDECRLIVTCTPSRSPLIPASAVRPGTHIVAIGADTPGKQELDRALFELAHTILVDDRAQCVDHGDFSYAVAAGIVLPTAARLLGDVLSVPAPERPVDAISLVDLTGIAALDIAMAEMALAL